jgi:hypothetical protein
MKKEIGILIFGAVMALILGVTVSHIVNVAVASCGHIMAELSNGQ